MVCACHRLVLFLMAHTNHTLPADFSTQLKSTVQWIDRAFEYFMEAYGLSVP